MPLSFSSLLDKAKKKQPDISERKLRQAYHFAKKHYVEEKRKNGDSYCSHVLAVADILVGLQFDEATLLSVFVTHFLRKNTDNILEVERMFGDEVAFLARNIARLADIQKKSEINSGDITRDMLLAMAKDPRVIIVRLASRLHNMQTLDAFLPEQQKEYAEQTLTLYAPMAGRLGIFALKSPLEDLSFFYVFPKAYARIKKQMTRYASYHDTIISHATQEITSIIRENGLQGTVKGRVKHLYSIYKKMRKKQKDSIDDIYDVFAIRILVPSVTDCYAMLGLIHKHYTPLSGRFKDYIAVPKPNGYRSLHTTVMGLSQFSDKAFPVEVQIRTFEMNEEAEFGSAAHWHYKEQGGTSKMHAPTNDIADETLALRRTYAITPRGDIKVLPENATPIDFAFSIHTDIGLHLRLAKANGKLVPLHYRIRNGDIIEIVTHKHAKPNQNWLSMCVSNRSKQKIKSFLQQKNMATLIREGKNMLNKYLQVYGVGALDQNYTLLREYLGKRRTKREREEILLRIGNGSLNAGVVAKNIAERAPETLLSSSLPKKRVHKPVISSDIPILVGGNADIPVRMASCCHPSPGDAIIGFVTRGAHVTIHRRDCKTIGKLDARRLIDAHFETDTPLIKKTLIIYRNGDRIGFLHDVLALLRKEEVNVCSVTFLTESNHHFPPISLCLEFQSEKNIDAIIAQLKMIPDVVNIVVA